MAVCEDKPHEIEKPSTVPDSVGLLLGFPPDLFRDHGNYYELAFPQRSTEWLGARKGRVTASIFGQVIGKSEYKTRQQLLLEMAGIAQPRDASWFGTQNMMRGTILEPVVREWYEDYFNRKVVERGLVIPKWDTRIGASVDGYIINPDDGKVRKQGIIEIKCPKPMYADLVDHSYRLKMGEKFPEFYNDHIKPDHYAQMQGCMAIVDADYCDYVVYDAKKIEHYTERVWRNRDYWDNELYPAIRSFLEERDALMAKAGE